MLYAVIQIDNQVLLFPAFMVNTLNNYSKLLGFFQHKDIADKFRDCFQNYMVNEPTPANMQKMYDHLTNIQDPAFVKFVETVGLSILKYIEKTIKVAHCPSQLNGQNFIYN